MNRVVGCEVRCLDDNASALHVSSLEEEQAARTVFCGGI
jgi:hypothetical protein